MTGVWALAAQAGDYTVSERAAVAGEMEEWLTSGGGGVVISTCHRAELYGLGTPPAIEVRGRWFGDGAVVHLHRVAAGLESVIVGEGEVLHQVREALRHAKQGSNLDFRLQRLFESAIASGRRARSGRTQSSGNLAHRAVAWLQGKTSLANRLVVVAGAGRMGSALAHSATRAGAEVVIASRDVDRAARLARVYSGAGVSLRDGARLLGQAAAVAVALGGEWSDLEETDVEDLPPIADISAPQAVPDAVRRRLNGSFLGVDDLYRRDAPPPGAYIKDAERLVALGTAEYMAWLDRAR